VLRCVRSFSAKKNKTAYCVIRWEGVAYKRVHVRFGSKADMCVGRKAAAGAAAYARMVGYAARRYVRAHGRSADGLALRALVVRSGYRTCGRSPRGGAQHTFYSQGHFRYPVTRNGQTSCEDAAMHICN
jgi:hypothetical protein